MKKKYLLISIIISNYNGTKLNILQECLMSFKKIDYPNYELILVDNASTDNSLKIAKKILGSDPKFRIIKNKINMYSQGLNLGLKAANGEFVAYFNNDIALEKKYFHNLIQAFRRYPKLALAQGKLLWYYDHSIIDSVGETMDMFGNPVTIGYKRKDKHQFDKEDKILSASGSACILKKSVLKDVGVYASEYGIGYEDMDLALRLRHKGFEVMRIPSAVCYHKRGATDLASIVRIKVRWHFNKNRIATMIKNYPIGLLLISLPVTVLIYFGIMLQEWMSGKFRLGITRITSLFWILLNLPYLFQQRISIRKSATKKSDDRMLNLFASANLIGKAKLVLLDPPKTRQV